LPERDLLFSFLATIKTFIAIYSFLDRYI